jgi:hypothetical protein
LYSHRKFFTRSGVCAYARPGQASAIAAKHPTVIVFVFQLNSSLLAPAILSVTRKMMPKD